MGRRVGVLGLLAAGLLVGGCALVGTSSPRSWWRSELSALPVPLAASVISGWSEVPTTADQGLADAAEPMCVSEAGANHLRDDLVIRDQRGPDAAAYLWADGREAMYCLV